MTKQAPRPAAAIALHYGVIFKHVLSIKHHTRKQAAAAWCVRVHLRDTQLAAAVLTRINQKCHKLPHRKS